ncbi:MAG: hypothetical protein K9N34_00870 [Candidatus Marinimicrobia bacterium]|nr:hypothetical protein [Candidatus Neomarinimicrobiota bacterium]MCF7841129.1 hypothetical protein [Candidatus Neomarinimicrobiota bacterium]
MDPISSQIQLQSHSASSQNTVEQYKNKNLDVENLKVRDIQLRQASEQLEASFLSQIVKAMEKTVPKNSLSGQQNTLSSMLFSSTMGDALAKGNPTGLSEMFYRALAEKDHGPINAITELKSWDFNTLHSLRMDLLKDTR